MTIFDMDLPILLAHGALGNWDEIIFGGVAVIFLAFMALSWVQSRNTEPDFDDAPSESATLDTTTSDHVSLE